MKLNYSIFMILSFVVSISCNSYKKQFSENGSENQAIKNAVLDFINTNKLAKKYSVFDVKVYNPLYKQKLITISENSKKWENECPYDDLIVVNILGSDFKNRYLNNEIKNDNKEIPTMHLEMDNKLFIWNDKNVDLNEKTIHVLKKYGIITNDKLDSMNIIDDTKKGTDYYFCKKNLKIFKKMTTNIATGYYEIPKINCK